MKVNYHMHTRRCHHALGGDEDYIRAAIQAGFEEVGFSDHSPWHYESGYVSGMRMKETELDQYIESIQHLQVKYQDQIHIKIGLECEYFPKMMPWLRNILDSKAIDYIILGNHFHESDEYGHYYGRPTLSKDVLFNYVHEVQSAIQTGLYSYIAHPDLVYYINTDDVVYREAMTSLCLAAKKANLPLEFNLLGFSENRQYPCEEFWRIAAQCHCQAIIGFDAHEPQALLNQKIYQKAQQYLNDLGIEIVDKIRFLK